MGEDAREKLAEFICEHTDTNPDWSPESLAIAILAAHPQIAPPQDVVEAARKVADNWYRRDQHWHEPLAKQIAALATAHAAREREECAAKLDEITNTHKRLAAQLASINQHAMAEMQRIRADEAEGNAAAIRARKP